MNKLKYYLFYIIISLIISYSNRQVKTNNNDIDINMYLHFLSSTSLLEVPSCTCSCDVIIGTLTSMIMFSLCNRVTLCGLASSRLLHGLIDRIKTSHSFKHGYNTGDGVVLYALISPQWPHACFAYKCNTIPRHVADLSGATCSVWNFCDNARFWKLDIKSGASVVILVCQLGKEGLRA